MDRIDSHALGDGGTEVTGLSPGWIGLFRGMPPDGDTVPLAGRDDGIFEKRRRSGPAAPVGGAHAGTSVVVGAGAGRSFWAGRSEEHTSELQSLRRISYAVFCLKKKKKQT